MEWYNAKIQEPAHGGKVLLSAKGVYFVSVYDADKKLFKGEQGTYPLGDSLYWTPFTDELIPYEDPAEQKKRKIDHYLNSFLQQIVDTSKDVILVLDNRLNIMLVNTTYEKLMGLKRESVVGKNLFEVNPKAENTIQHDYLKRAVAGESLRLSGRPGIARPDYLVESHFTPLTIDGNVEGVLVRSMVEKNEADDKSL